MNPKTPFHTPGLIPKVKSINQTNKETIVEAIKTTKELFCNSLQVGQETFSNNSDTTSSIYVLIFLILINISG